jgi:hypothetical protein
MSILRLHYFSHEQYAFNIYVGKPGDLFVYWYWRRTLVLVQANTENKDILYIYTSNYGNTV